VLNQSTICAHFDTIFATLKLPVTPEEVD